MRTVNEVSKLTGVSVRTLQYYDSIGLLKPTEYTESGYRLYDDTALETLQQIMFFKELEFSLKEIKEIISDPDFDKAKALEQQIDLLTLKKEHLENLIDFARGVKALGTRNIDFTAFDTKKIDEYSMQVKKQWGNTPEYEEFKEKSKDWTKDYEDKMMRDFMNIFYEFGQMKEMNITSQKVQNQVKKLQEYITENFYHCSNEILGCLGQMYSGGGDFTTNIDNVGGEGTALFVDKAIQEYIK